MQFVDETQILLKAGNGGNGIVAWRREVGVPEGGPYGGDGGDGGCIYVIGDYNVDTLFNIRNKKSIIAKNGQNGQTQKATGAHGQDIYINVPLGTTIINLVNQEIIVEILHHQQVHCLCKGGRGGHGNAYFKNSRNRAPSLHENGEIGESKRVQLKLKYLADVGIIGLPNAGKSTLISAISNAKPKIASYQFTTLTPVLGRVNYANQHLTFADVPGLIEGASAGKGLGHDFLKHIERCQLLIHLISLNPLDTTDPIRDYNVIKHELELYANNIIKKPIIVVGNKIDCDDIEKNIVLFKKKFPTSLIVSAKTMINTNDLVKLVFDQYQVIKNQFDQEQLVINHQQQSLSRSDNDDIDIKKDLIIKQLETSLWSVESKYLAYWQNRIPLDTNDNMIRFNQKIQSCDLENKILQMGGKAGDTMKINGVDFIID